MTAWIGLTLIVGAFFYMIVGVFAAGESGVLVFRAIAYGTVVALIGVALMGVT